MTLPRNKCRPLPAAGTADRRPGPRLCNAAEPGPPRGPTSGGTRPRGAGERRGAAAPPAPSRRCSGRRGVTPGRGGQRPPSPPRPPRGVLRRAPPLRRTKKPRTPSPPGTPPPSAGIPPAPAALPLPRRRAASPARPGSVYLSRPPLLRRAARPAAGRRRAAWQRGAVRGSAQPRLAGRLWRPRWSGLRCAPGGGLGSAPRRRRRKRRRSAAPLRSPFLSSSPPSPARQRHLKWRRRARPVPPRRFPGGGGSEPTARGMRGMRDSPLRGGRAPRRHRLSQPVATEPLRPDSPGTAAPQSRGSSLSSTSGPAFFLVYYCFG